MIVGDFKHVNLRALLHEDPKTNEKYGWSDNLGPESKASTVLMNLSKKHFIEIVVAYFDFSVLLVNYEGLLVRVFVRI